MMAIFLFVVKDNVDVFVKHYHEIENNTSYENFVEVFQINFYQHQSQICFESLSLFSVTLLLITLCLIIF